MTEKQYARLVKELSPPSPMGKDCFWAFMVGGLICTLGQLAIMGYTALGLEKTDASCAASMTQWAAVEALTGPQDEVTAMVEAFRERRDYIVSALNSIDGISCVLPKGAFYAFPNISSFGITSSTLSHLI